MSAEVIALLQNNICLLCLRTGGPRRDQKCAEIKAHSNNLTHVEGSLLSVHLLRISQMGSSRLHLHVEVRRPIRRLKQMPIKPPTRSPARVGHLRTSVDDSRHRADRSLWLATLHVTWTAMALGTMAWGPRQLSLDALMPRRHGRHQRFVSIGFQILTLLNDGFGR
jgi:hypothetical protein